jgi:F-type H+-transporting ATPase subunit b
MNLMQFYIPEWFFVALNLAILILVLKRLFWAPVSKILEDRQAMAAKTEQDAGEAAALRADMEQLRLQLDADMEARSLDLMKEARSHASQEYSRIVAEAEKKAELILSDAGAQARREQDRIARELKRHVASATIEAAGFLMRSNMDTARNNQLLEAFLEERDASA